LSHSDYATEKRIKIRNHVIEQPATEKRIKIRNHWIEIPVKHTKAIDKIIKTVVAPKKEVKKTVKKVTHPIYHKPVQKAVQKAVHKAVPPPLRFNFGGDRYQTPTTPYHKPVQKTVHKAVSSGYSRPGDTKAKKKKKNIPSWVQNLIDGFRGRA